MIEFLFTVKVHAFDFKDLTVCDFCFKVVTHAVFAVAVRAPWEMEKESFLVLTAADITHYEIWI